MKRTLKRLSAVIVVIGLMLIAAGAANQQARIIINGTELRSKGFVQGGRTFVPLRDVTEAIGAKVTWFGQTHEILIQRDIPRCYDAGGGQFPIVGTDHYEILFKIGSRSIAYIDPHLVNKAYGVIDAAPQIVDDVTMVPLRASCEYLAATVEWNNITSTATVTSKSMNMEEWKKYDESDIAIAERKALDEFTNKTLEPKALYITPYGCSQRVDILTWVGPAYGLPDNLNFIYSNYRKGAYFSETGSLTGDAGSSIYDVPDYPKGFTDADDTGTFSDIRMMSLEGNVWLNKEDLIRLGLLDK